MSKRTSLSTSARVLRPSALATAVATACLLGAAPSWAFSSGSTGADGALNPAVNTEIQLPASGILNYTSINIPAGVTVKFKRNALNTPVYLLVQGNSTIAGIIDVTGGDAKQSGTYGDGNLGDDGIAGAGGPGGFDGGRGGRDDAQSRPDIIIGGSGLGPGGGKGGNTRANGCYGGIYYHYIGRGGAFGAKGSSAYGNGYHCTADANDFGVAQPYGAPALTALIGGSGGGGGNGGVNFSGSGGGGGGGAILIATSGVMSITGQINATGGDGGNAAGTGQGQPGAGGSGGAIRLIATTLSGNGGIYANGGCLNSSNVRRQNCNVYEYGGSVGRIRVEGDSVTFAGTAQPPYSADTPAPVFVSNAPTLRIASIAGTSVPANPTGNADVALPTSLVNPVVVNFETTNIPPGNTVKLRVVPAYGDYVEALSPAITGSNASGNTSVSVSLPQGPSTLQAITSYTVTVAMGESLSRFAQNERVEKVEIVAGVGKAESIARLITVSGKSFDVPTSILQMVGFNG